MTAERAMMSKGAPRPIFCVLSEEQRVEFEQGIGRDVPPGARMVFESDPDDALDKVGELDPCLVIVGMTIDPMEGLEFLAMLMARYPDYHEKVLVLPEVGDPFPPMLQYRDRTTGRSSPEELEYEDIPALIRSIAAPHLESQQAPKPVVKPVPAARPNPAPATAAQSLDKPEPPAMAQAPAPARPLGAAPAAPPPAEKPATATPAHKPAATPAILRPASPDPSSGVQKVAPVAAMKPAPMKAINPSANAGSPPHPAKPASPPGSGPVGGFANMVMQPQAPASPTKSADPVALADTMLGGSAPLVHTPLDDPQKPAEPALPIAPPPPAATAPAAMPPAAVPPAPPAAMAPMPPAPPLAMPPAPQAAATPNMPAFGGSPFASGAELTPDALPVPPMPSAEETTGAQGVVSPATQGPSTSTLLDKLAFGPLKNLPSDKRWIAWLALAAPVALLLLLIAILLFASGGASQSTTTSVEKPAKGAPKPAKAQLQKAQPAQEKAARQAPKAAAKADDDAEAATEEETEEASAAPEAKKPALSQLTRLPFSFERGKHDYTVEDQAELDQLVSAIVTAVRADTNIRVEVGGHTSEEGSPSFNKLLGKQRANEALAYLMRKGVPVERAIIHNYQSSKPAASGNEEDQRRVTIRLVR